MTSLRLPPPFIWPLSFSALQLDHPLRKPGHNIGGFSIFTSNGMHLKPQAFSLKNGIYLSFGRRSQCLSFQRCEKVPLHQPKMKMSMEGHLSTALSSIMVPPDHLQTCITSYHYLSCSHYRSQWCCFLVLDYIRRTDQEETTILLQTNQLQKITYWSQAQHEEGDLVVGSEGVPTVVSRQYFYTVNTQTHNCVHAYTQACTLRISALPSFAQKTMNQLQT